MKGQAKRILEYLLAHSNEDVSAVDLHRIGSGKELGWCASISRRISDLRALGYQVRKSKDVMVNSQRRTWYRLTVPQEVAVIEPKELMEKGTI